MDILLGNAGNCFKCFFHSINLLLYSLKTGRTQFDVILYLLVALLFFIYNQNIIFSKIILRKVYAVRCMWETGRGLYPKNQSRFVWHRRKIIDGMLCWLTFGVLLFWRRFIVRSFYHFPNCRWSGAAAALGHGHQTENRGWGIWKGYN